jgi:hypothetical protein
MDAVLLVTVRLPTFEVPVPGGGLLVPHVDVLPPVPPEPVTWPHPLSPPQPLRARVMKNRAMMEASVRMILYSILTEVCVAVTH